ncbi:sugar phosphate isomerase/epimerase [Micromonospora sp. 15K316]|uniref:sugar phosphate isomerase/epimerase family protein n=1 Tax=Micromonospora sp. 15K316 TaxID=2530376 RepID=UPI001048E046|nr:sugar phosphate isomerase/epimerase [Micromonospora sp. 15K316]TDC38362.1 sugar phosphate isomerase/epimerase [Micromonospora sp. 15K316]
MTGQTAELIFWPGSLGERGFEAVLDAAQAGGFAAAALSPLMIHNLLDSGRDGPQLRAEAAARGVRLAQLDGATSWAPIWYGEEMAAPLRERFDFSEDRILDLAEAAGMDSVLAAGAFDPGAVPLDELVTSFATFCDRAAERDIRVELEFVPFWGVPSLAVAWDIVRGADRPNGNLMIDTWHLLKGSADPQAALALLPDIPGEKLTGLQLADALTAPQAETLYGEGRFRRFPGDGELPLDQVARLLLDKGGLVRVGAEVFGEAVDSLDPAAAGARAAATVTATLARAAA